jgi:lysosomal acid phosphatase
MPPLDNLNPLPIPWQPVPVYTLFRDTDDLIVQRRPCARYDKVFQEVLQSDEVLKMDEDNQQLYHKLSIGTGENISSLHSVELLHDTLQAEKAAGWQLPEWTEGVFPSKTLPIAEFYVRLLTKTPFMKKIKAGPLVTEIMENMQANKNKMESEKALNIYAAHDITLINLMNSMGFLDQTSNKPDFSSALAIELHDSFTGEDLDVKIYYYFNDNDKYPKAINIEGCNDPCTLTQFKKVMNHLIVNDYEKLCEDV